MTNLELYYKAKKVLDSCETPNQVVTAIQYIKLARKASASSWEDHYDELTRVAIAKYRKIKVYNDMVGK